MAFVDGRVDFGPVIHTITGHRGRGLGDLIEQGAALGGIIDAMVGQRGGDNPTRAGAHADVQGPPGAPPLGAMLLKQPFARAAQRPPRAVDQPVDGPAAGAWRRGQRHRPSPAGEGGVIRNRQIQPEQLEDGGEQPLGLPQRQPEPRSQLQRRCDRQARRARRTTRRSARRRFPLLDCLLADPEREAATLAQGGVELGPIRHCALRPGNVMATSGIGLVRHSGRPERRRGLDLRHWPHP